MTPAAAEAGLMGVEGVAALTGWGSMTLLPPPPFCTSLFFTVVRLPTLSTLETPAHTPHFTDGPAAEPCTSVPLATRVQHGPGALGQALMPAALVAVAVGVNAPAPEGRGGACGGTWETHKCTAASDLGGILEAKQSLPPQGGNLLHLQGPHSGGPHSSSALINITYNMAALHQQPFL